MKSPEFDYVKARTLEQAIALLEANGDEAFMPSTKTRQSAIYLVEELKKPWGGFSFGLRSEAVKVNGNAFDPGIAPPLPRRPEAICRWTDSTRDTLVVPT